jgi:hypothetical protein
LRIQFWRDRWQRDDRRRIEEFKQLPTEVSSNHAAVRLQMNNLLVLQRIHLSGRESYE